MAELKDKINYVTNAREQAEREAVTDYMGGQSHDILLWIVVTNISCCDCSVPRGVRSPHTSRDSLRMYPFKVLRPCLIRYY